MRMNPILRLATLLLAALSCAFFISTPAWAQNTVNTERAGIMKTVTGDVRVRDAQGERPLKSGDAVKTNDRLISGKQSTASVVLRDGTTLVLAENSQLVLDQFAFNSTTQDGSLLINLLQGSMRMLTGLIAKVNPQAIQIKTKTVSVGIRGTDFIVETDDKP
ncbi:MAG TPA: FecR family protein [Burkholderiaceae bacterium]|nr:FecR family protein [Burkholderiaceae bacterium]